MEELKMKLFDLHCDIGTDCYDAKKKGELEPFKNRHFDKLLKGEINYVCCACFFAGSESWEVMQEMILLMNEELEKNDVLFVKEKSDFHQEANIHAIISVEGMCGVKSEPVAAIKWMWEHNVKVASLTWNDENYLATGVKGNETRGLSEAGLLAIKEMEKLGMVLDVSHLNEASFWDVIKNYNGKLCATHSNARDLCNHNRNLTSQQIIALAKKGAIIGMNAAKGFVNTNDELSDVLHLAKHARYIADLVGVDHVACGFDFMDFLGVYGKEAMAKDISSSDMAQNFVVALREVGFNEEEIEKIAYKNALELLTK